MKSRQEAFNDYEGFVKKFSKPKKTTDDCYTPEGVYNAIANWVAKEYNVDRRNFIRPFYPGGDYENYNYKPSDIVVDNPPFSIETQILDFYNANNIKYFLFCKACMSHYALRGSLIAVEGNITYENGAKIGTNFITNLEPHEVLMKSAPDLHDIIVEAGRKTHQEVKKQVPEYKYPSEILTAQMVQKLSNHGVNFEMKRDEAEFVRTLDMQRKYGKKKGIYGAGFYISEKAAAEKEAAEKEAAKEVVEWQLSPRELEIIDSLNKAAERRNKDD